MQMQALQFLPKENCLEIRTIPKPQIKDKKSVLVKVCYAGICKTDLDLFSQNFILQDVLPEAITLGHEICGIVEEIGTKVSLVQVGDRVAINPHKICRICRQCKAGQFHFCEKVPTTIGFYGIGGWAQYTICEESQTFKLKDNIPLDRSVLSELVSRLTNSLEVIGPVQINHRFLIFGSDMAAAILMTLLHYQGVEFVTIVEQGPNFNPNLKKLETGYKVFTLQEFEKYYNGKCNEFDFIMETSGTPVAFDFYSRLIDYGGTICLFGVTTLAKNAIINPVTFYQKEITLLGAVFNTLTFTKALKLIELMGAKYMDFDKLGIKLYKLDQYQEALADLTNGKAVKAVFTFETTNEDDNTSKSLSTI